MAADVGDWKRWFAWHPVKIDGRRYWLRRVERRHVSVKIVVVFGAAATSEFWNYRLVYERWEFAKRLEAWKRVIERGMTSLSTPPPKPEGAKDVQEVMFTTTRLVLEIEDFSEQAITEMRSAKQTYGRPQDST